MERPRVKLNSQICDEASAWFVQCRAGDLDESGRRELDRWLRKSPEHVSAYLEVAAIWGEGLSLDPNNKWDLDTLTVQASADPDNVVMLPAVAGTAYAVFGANAPTPIRQGPETEFSHGSLTPQSGHAAASGGLVEASGPSGHLLVKVSKRRLWALAASVVGLAVISGAWTWLDLSSPVYTTTIGEQRSIELADGSTVSMNSKSKIRIRYSKNERLVELLRGQALFHVAKDPVHPFIVSASGTRVRAVGTQFDVYEKHTGTTVTVIEGRVAILPKSSVGSGSADATRAAIPFSPVAPIMLSAGEQVTVTPHVAQRIEHANVAAATAWRDREIVFDSATLGEVAEEFNRYNERQIVIDQPDLLTFHVSGVFSSTNPEDLIQFLRDRPGVIVREEGRQIRVAKKN